MSRPKIITVIGARPQFIKAAAVSRAILASARLEEKILHTGQHFDENMSAIFFKELAIPEPAFHFAIHGGGHGEMTGRMLEVVEKICKDETPDLMLIYGDTNSTLAGALAAAKLHIPVAHVEAGLRSFNRRMPEEINRVVADHLSTLLFCPTHESVRNLASEGITRGVHHAGDVMYDATLFARAEALQKSRILETLGLSENKYAVCTLHRAENTDDPEQLGRLVSYLETQAQQHPVIFPVHPRTRGAMAKAGIAPKRLTLVDPLGYIDLNRLLASAAAVFTDSGGLQKEAYFHGVACVTLRTETEWVETIAHGWNRLWSVGNYAEPRRPIPEYGTGKAAENIVGIIERTLSTGP